MKIYCLTLDLKDDPALIAEYKRHHEPSNIWPEIAENIRSQGILREEIFLLGTRMVMVLHTADHFNFETKAVNDRTNYKVQEWEDLMWKFQEPVPQAKPGERWALMEKIFAI